MFPAAHLSNESHWLRSHQPVSADGKTASPCFVHARRFFSVLDAFSLQSVSFFFSSTLLAWFPFCFLDLISFFILIRSYSLFFMVSNFDLMGDFWSDKTALKACAKCGTAFWSGLARLSSSFHFKWTEGSKARQGAPKHVNSHQRRSHKGSSMIDRRPRIRPSPPDVGSNRPPSSRVIAAGDFLLSFLSFFV